VGPNAEAVVISTSTVALANTRATTENVKKIHVIFSLKLYYAIKVNIFI
jgi:hypothetical protein